MKYIIFLFALFLFVSCENGGEAAKTEPAAESAGFVSLSDKEMSAAGIQAGQAERRNISGKLQVNGVVDVPPQNLVSVSFPLGGFLKSTDLLPGAKVNRGQVIAVMEDPSFIQLQQDYLVAKARLEAAEKEFNRQKTLNVNKSVSDKSLEQAQREYKTEEVNVSAFREKLLLIGLSPERLNENNISRTVSIYSPIDGYVVRVNVNIGKYVNPTDVLFELVNPTDLHLALTVFEKDLPKIQVGQKVTAYIANAPSHRFSAEVILAGKMLDENRSAIVHCHFIQPEKELLPGMFLSAEILTEGDSSWCVPEDAVVRSGDTEFIFVQKGKNEFERIPVQPGTTENGWTQLPGTDLTGKTIIRSNAYQALMKMENKPEEE